ncbi:terminase large subunit domain-containing protein [Sphingomonas zeae]
MDKLPPDHDMPLPASTMPIPVDAKRQARSLYWRGWGVTQIADELGLNRATVESWKQRGRWDEAPSLSKIEDALECRLNTLIAKDHKTGGDFKEIDLLMRQVVAGARVRRYQAPGGHEGDLNEKVANRNAGERKDRAPPNHFTAEQIERLEEIFHKENFEYNELWWENRHQRTRMVLKSRQIGATFYFAREALLDALKGGGNQIFLSASKNQAHVFKKYIIQFAARVGVKLKGDPIVVSAEGLPEDKPTAELIFLGTNARTAQGYTGNFYFDEFFWTFGFEELNKVAKAMASHKHWRKTYLSTPSTVAHQAYSLWTGAAYNRRRKKADQVAIDVGYETLKAGHLGADRIWRHMLTLEDAAAQGCDLFDLAEVKDENAPDEYANLYGCQFVDDSLSAFKFNELQRCTVDADVDWRDVNLLSDRPVGNREVWAGYDPQESADGDNAALVIALPPEGPDGKFRLLEKHQLRGADFQEQAEFILARLKRYNCTYIGVDASGVGASVYQLLRDRHRGVAKIQYSLEAKAQMVMKAQHTIARGRVEFDGGWTDLQSAFLSIKKALTQSGKAITFKASRADETGHADMAWAVMHIFINEPLDGQSRPKTRMEVIGDEEDQTPSYDGFRDEFGEPYGYLRRHQCRGGRGSGRRGGLHLRRPGVGPRPAHPARYGHAGLSERPVVRAAAVARRPGAVVQRIAAS